MKRGKKYILVSAAIVSLAILVGLGATLAYGPPGSWGKGFHPGFQRAGFHSKHHGEEMSEFILWRMDRHMKALDLSQEQEGRYEEMREQIKNSLAGLMEERRRFHEMMREEMNKDKPDIEALANLIKGRLEKMQAQISGKLDLFVEFYGLLDPDQKAQVIDMIRSRAGGFNGEPESHS